MKPARADDIRKRELAQIHIAKQQLGLDDETYRSMLWTVARVKSASDLDWAGRKNVLDHFKSHGWTNRPSRKAKQSRPLADDPQSKMIRALWLSLHEKGIVRDPSERALAAYVKRVTRREALQWLNVKEAAHVIETLKKWLDRIQQESV
ncbi:regulatory protein GemA [Nitrosospira lacus]|uniref:GemA protein n=1 Tax=Nitrosospira lacus TaxID=1288494 RepID=A0A1W6SQQ3_9PROT|nr:regulatory protein GemA [Nitrosospira lacus]ARO88137.1 regulatory protein GemA [Nitrosospira lacus]